jgi:hypothetical protein
MSTNISESQGAFPKELIDEAVQKFQNYIQKCKMALFNNTKAMFYHMNEKGMFVIYFDSPEDAIEELNDKKMDDILRTKDTAFPFKKDPYYITISRFLDAMEDADEDGTDSSIAENYKHTKNLLQFCDPEHAFVVLMSIRYDPLDKTMVFQKVFLMTHPEGDNPTIHVDFKINDESAFKDFDADMKLAKIFCMDAYTFKMMKRKIPESTRALLLESDDPVADMKAVVREIKKTATCSFCNKENARFMCTKCKVAKYCERDCQLLHFERHKKECGDAGFYRNFLEETITKWEQKQKDDKIVEIDDKHSGPILEPVTVPEELQKARPAEKKA